MELGIGTWKAVNLNKQTHVFFFFKEKFNLRNIFRNYLWKKKKKITCFFYNFLYTHKSSIKIFFFYKNYPLTNSLKTSINFYPLN